MHGSVLIWPSSIRFRRHEIDEDNAFVPTLYLEPFISGNILNVKLVSNRNFYKSIWNTGKNIPKLDLHCMKDKFSTNNCTKWPNPLQILTNFKIPLFALDCY
jgi:hypothetical protein